MFTPRSRRFGDGICGVINYSEVPSFMRWWTARRVRANVRVLFFFLKKIYLVVLYLLIMNMLIEYRGQATSALIRWGEWCWARGGVHVWG